MKGQRSPFGIFENLVATFPLQDPSHWVAITVESQRGLQKEVVVVEGVTG